MPYCISWFYTGNLIFSMHYVYECVDYKSLIANRQKVPGLFKATLQVTVGVAE